MSVLSTNFLLSFSEYVVLKHSKNKTWNQIKHDEDINIIRVYVPPISATKYFFPGTLRSLFVPDNKTLCDTLWQYIEAASGSNAIVSWDLGIPACA